jgi:gamma-glutamylcyclotransferase
MRNDNDNRMAWIRNLELLASGGPQYTVEFELGSEARIVGILDYAEGRIICAPMSTEKSRNGLWLYNLIIRFPFGQREHNRKATEKGYYFKDGIVGELLALMSVFFRCRFYLMSSRNVPEDPKRGMPIKTEFPFFRVECNPGIHPPVFQESGKNLANGFKEFLEVVKRLDGKLHQKFALACHHYARSVKEIGVDSEMVFIRLVSAVEALSKDMPLTQKDDALEEEGVKSLIAQSGLSKELKSELKSVFDVRKSRKRFIRFVESHCSGFFKGGNVKARHTKIRRADLSEILDVIYKARSRYLHAGEPMFLSKPIKGGEKWDTDPIFEMIVDNRKFPASQKLPYTYFFEGLVHRCLLSYLKANASLSAGGAMSQQIFAYGSNMCSGRFRDYGVSPEGIATAAVLSEYRLLFNKRSTRDHSGKANVEPHEGSQVWGVVYTVSDNDMRRLDEGEGGYQRVRLSVRLADNKDAEVWIYLASRPSNDPTLRPYTWYKRFLVEGAEEHALPPEYVANMERIEAVQDPNAQRDREKRELACRAEA